MIKTLWVLKLENGTHYYFTSKPKVATFLKDRLGITNIKYGQAMHFVYDSNDALFGYFIKEILH